MRWLAPRDRDAVTWRGWVRAQPALAAAVLVFCVASVAGLWAALPEGLFSGARSRRESGEASTSSAPAGLPAGVMPRGPGPETPEAGPAAPVAELAAPGPWVWQPASAPSARGLALAYAYRTRAPGGDSRFDWVVRLVGSQPLLDGIREVAWQMDPPPANDGEDLISRDRARDGFPLFGDGPGGWFGVSAVVRFQGGEEETLSRRIELPEP